MERIFITGANRGIGLEVTRQYLERDDTRVFTSARHPETATELHALAAAQPERLTVPLCAGQRGGVEHRADQTHNRCEGKVYYLSLQNLRA